MKKKYKYFVSFIGDGKFGDTIFEIDKPLNCWERFTEVREHIEKAVNYKKVVLLNFKRIK